MKKLSTLAKELDFTTETEYFDYMIESHVNGQFTQCRNLFNDMKKEDRKRFIEYLGRPENCGQNMNSTYKYYVSIAV